MYIQKYKNPINSYIHSQVYIYIHIYSLNRRTINFAHFARRYKISKKGEMGENGGAHSPPEPINVTGSNQARQQRLECGRAEPA